MKTKQIVIRQGDVALVQVPTLPQGCAEVPLDKGRIVLAYGEVTGHSHSIADHSRRLLDNEACDANNALVSAALKAEAFGDIERAKEMAEAAISRAKARLWRAPNGERFLEVREAVSLRHEEHEPHRIPPGVYHLPQQVEYSPAEIRRVAD